MLQILSPFITIITIIFFIVNFIIFSKKRRVVKKALLWWFIGAIGAAIIFGFLKLFIPNTECDPQTAYYGCYEFFPILLISLLWLLFFPIIGTFYLYITSRRYKTTLGIVMGIVGAVLLTLTIFSLPPLL